MKVMTLVGTRPEIIRLSQVIRWLDQLCEHTLVHTGQNYDPDLGDIFFRELQIRQPDVHLGIRSSRFAEQAGQILAKAGEILEQVKPDRLVILGDTNTGLAAIAAARMGIPVYHLEAGNRSYDDRVPEEINRRIIDHSSTILMPYTHRSKENLLREGIERERIFVIGNPIYEVLETYAPQIEASDVRQRLDVQNQPFFLATMHRAENVDEPQRLAQLLTGLEQLGVQHQVPVFVSVHPRTQNKLDQFGLAPQSPLVRLMKPWGFFDFVKLEKTARLVISDSGTVQEECAILGVPNVTIRDVSERLETVECGSSILGGAKPNDLLRAANVALSLPSDWAPPSEYTTRNVAHAVVKIILSYSSLRRHATL